MSDQTATNYSHWLLNKSENEIRKKWHLLNPENKEAALNIDIEDAGLSDQEKRAFAALYLKLSRDLFIQKSQGWSDPTGKHAAKRLGEFAKYAPKEALETYESFLERKSIHHEGNDHIALDQTGAIAIHNPAKTAKIFESYIKKTGGNDFSPFLPGLVKKEAEILGQMIEAHPKAFAPVFVGAFQTYGSRPQLLQYFSEKLPMVFESHPDIVKECIDTSLEKAKSHKSPEANNHGVSKYSDAVNAVISPVIVWMSRDKKNFETHIDACVDVYNQNQSTATSEIYRGFKDILNGEMDQYGRDGFKASEALKAYIWNRRSEPWAGSFIRSNNEIFDDLINSDGGSGSNFTAGSMRAVRGADAIRYDGPATPGF